MKQPRLKMKGSVGLVTAFLAAGVSGATASDERLGGNWQGIYLGLGGGYANAGKHITSPVSFTTNTDIGMFGLYTGYNYQINNVVLGIEADAYVGFGGATPFAKLPVPSVLKNKVGGNWSLRGRLGLDFDRFMPYVTGGYAGSTSKLTFASGYSGSESKVLHGWTVGGGAEYKLHGNWQLRLDYQYQVFGERTYFGGIVPPAGIKQNVNIHQLTLGLARKF